MVTEDKELLVDLCGRLPYGVILQITYKDIQGDETVKKRNVMLSDDNLHYITSPSHWILYKPYLRSMSSMTDEEKYEYQYITERWMYDNSYSIADSIDWLNDHHFDYRDFIERKMAIEISKDKLDKLRYECNI